MALANSTQFDALLTTKQVAELTGVSLHTLNWWRHLNDGSGPKWFTLGPRKVVYKESDVRAWLDAQYAASPSKSA